MAKGAPAPGPEPDRRLVRVNCPHCGGDGKDANGNKCRPCHGSGTVLTDRDS